MFFISLRVAAVFHRQVTTQAWNNDLIPVQRISTGYRTAGVIRQYENTFFACRPE
jgi:hypothetical protein